MINYYEKLEEEKKKELSLAIKLLYEQTFILERTYEKRTKRVQFNKQFHICNEHIPFLRWYFSIAGMRVEENKQLGIIYLESDKVVGDKMTRLTTLYTLILKLLYDEQMASASTSMNIITTLADINERLQTFGLLKTKPSTTEIKKALAFLKHYQVIEAMDGMEDVEGISRFIIYPTINIVLDGEKVKALLNTFLELENKDNEIEETEEEDAE